MKNINLTPHSSVPVKGGHGNKPFIFVSIFLLTLLSFVCFYLYILSDKQWQGNFGAKIGSLFNIEKPKKLIKKSESKKNFEVKKHFERQSKGQEYAENIDRVEIEEEEPVLEKTDSETAGIEVEEKEDLIEADVVASEIEEKTMSAKREKRVAAVEIEKEPALTEAEGKQEGGDKEKTKQLESALNKNFHYYIQVCSCVIKENADKIFRKLGDQGYSPVMEEIVRHVNMHNIYTDDFTKKSEALEFLNRLKNDGFDSVFLPSSDSGYKIRITSCFYMKSAKGVIKRLNRLGYETSIRKEFIPTRMYSVLLGNFESLEEAEAASNRLIKMGYPQPILKRNPKT
jgi:cell division septation protein DedD